MIIVASPEVLFGLDRITMDDENAIYGSVNFGHKIVRLSSDGKRLSEITSGTPLGFLTNLSFGSGSDAHNLFITNFGVIPFLSDSPIPENVSSAIINVRIGCK